MSENMDELEKLVAELSDIETEQHSIKQKQTLTGVLIVLLSLAIALTLFVVVL
jgi:hypothetical protein